jgi:hypothetical protein
MGVTDRLLHRPPTARAAGPVDPWRPLGAQSTLTRPSGRWTRGGLGVVPVGGFRTQAGRDSRAEARDVDWLLTPKQPQGLDMDGIRIEIPQRRGLVLYRGVATLSLEV